MIHHTSIHSVIESYGVENDWRLLISYRTGKYFLLQISKSSNDRGGSSRVRRCNFARGFNDRTLIGLVAEDLNLNKGIYVYFIGCVDCTPSDSQWVIEEFEWATLATKLVFRSIFRYIWVANAWIGRFSRPTIWF